MIITDHSQLNNSKPPASSLSILVFDTCKMMSPSGGTKGGEGTKGEEGTKGGRVLRGGTNGVLRGVLREVLRGVLKGGGY